ncbi:putative ATP-dependent helicase YprA [Collibacillus ludicampi]|uniref:ATP-dependent helicase YprA n=2 Tax=Collibacillus ludicampi TaxID=2771369 RepID=A0AAV4LJV6_9BACL|nr:putative ATP-dependent helicase YprA [Collibacillus ludicampi]
MNIDLLLDEWKRSESFMQNVTHWEVFPGQQAVYADFPAHMDRRLIDSLMKKGIRKLYSHQAEAFTRVKRGENVVVVTPTASGKTLCYNLPVLDRILQDPSARSLYLFPTKALSQDQMKELHETVEHLEQNIKTFTYDGDTPVTARQTIRQAGHIVVTNPDMLHSGILPHHTKWVKLFENLAFVVIDEIHMYRGVFGSHVANVIRRLKRICKFYGSRPQFICCSATIANPRELAQELFDEEFVLLDRSGAPRGERHFIFYNPPVVNRQLGIRRSSLLESRKIATQLLTNDIQTIVFTKSRTQVEVLLTYLQETTKGVIPRQAVRGYRGGYLPNERREIERGLRNGEVKGVVSTNALELGIDIGSLEACVITGYPGAIASVWQQAGRAGRRQGKSVTVLVASSSPLDQYIIQHPEYFFKGTPEHAWVHPENLIILVDHLKCAAYELPFEAGETFGVATTEEILDFLAEERILNKAKDGRYYWMSDSLPSHEISLRSAAQENVLVIDMTEKNRVIGETDRFSALTTLHEKAIYIHEGVQYQVERLDLENGKAFVRKVDCDYYTDAELAVNLRVLDEFRGEQEGCIRHGFGEVMVNALPTIYKKIKFDTHENLGWGQIHLPETEIHTLSYWIAFTELPKREWSKEEVESGLIGLANLLKGVAPLYLMCAPGDIYVHPQVKAPHTKAPTVFLYDSYPGGIGLADTFYRLRQQIFQTALEMVKDCPCESGCPSCVGPKELVGESGKEITRELLQIVAHEGVMV